MATIKFNGLDVTYETKVGDMEIEFEGHLRKYYDGRSNCYEFEPDYFADDDSGDYFENNWEEVNEAIIDAYYESLK